MPPARRRSGAKQEAANTAVEDTTTEAEATEGEDEGDEKPARAPRAPKVYAVKDAELANSLIGDDHDEINEGDPVTGEMLDSMRKNKAKWDSPEDGGIKHVFGSNSAIPLRNLYNKWLAEGDEESALDINDVDALYEALIGGDGWVTLAARTGNTATEVREALKDKVMEEQDVDITEGGRAYGKGENWTWVSADQLNEAKAANGNGDDEEEGDEEGTEASSDADDTEDEGSTEEEAPAPRRRRRAPAA